MMNKKGQVLVVFVLILPLILLFVGLIIDIGNSLVVRRKAENTIKDAIIYTLKDYDGLENVNLNLIEKNIKSNIEEYDDLKVNLNEDIITVKFSMTYKSIFNNIFNIGLNKIKLEVKYDVINKKIVREWLLWLLKEVK